MTKTSRSSEAISPRRDPGSLKPTNLRLDEKSRSTCATPSLSRLGGPHSPEQEPISLKTHPLRLSETLKMAIGLPEREMQIPSLITHSTHSNLIQFAPQIIPNRIRAYQNTLHKLQHHIGIV
ncbi:hypothetical protein DEO72_LG3g674 [Vigna unguiculata]|uniref:Uncharacterized protein n=1 Tax=Vigna unguiculata TaxID=3917 RepID=A0A4D6LCD4_VIGUN|nr:hypothetical protein DEO72_LG3g674 [Vigna unguiculata]